MVSAAPTQTSRRRENMVGVSMVLAEYIEFKQGLNRTMLTPTMFSRGRTSGGIMVSYVYEGV